MTAGSSSAALRSRTLWSALVVSALLLGGCAGTAPGRDYPRVASVALTHPEDSRLGKQFADAAEAHATASAFRVLGVGLDGFRARLQMIRAAERSLDLQYYIFRGDDTGRLLTDELHRAAERGVRIRMLIDDGDTLQGDEQILRLLELPTVEIRIFNPLRYRGHLQFFRMLELLTFAPRLDYRMHNKLFIVDGSAALIGGRNVGNQYFQVDPESQFADDDVFSAGPVVGQLAATFDEFWNSPQSIPAQALGSRHAKHGTANRMDQPRHDSEPSAAPQPGVDYAALQTGDDPLAGILSGKLPLTWAPARIVYDSPNKKQVVDGSVPGSLIARDVLDTIRLVHSELLLVTPFFVPDAEQLKTLEALRSHDVRVRALTNSLESNPEVAAQSGYANYRIPLLRAGVELYEVRALLGNTRGSGQSKRISRFGNYALHAKLYVFDRRKLFIGSMNFDQRSKRINTEIGLIIDSAELADQAAHRFDAMIKPENCYLLALRSDSAAGRSAHLVWDTARDGKPLEFSTEPARTTWQRIKGRLLSLLPLDSEL